MAHEPHIVIDEYINDQYRSQRHKVIQPEFRTGKSPKNVSLFQLKKILIVYE